jgi:hypothetical protein
MSAVRFRADPARETHFASNGRRYHDAVRGTTTANLRARGTVGVDCSAQRLPHALTY